MKRFIVIFIIFLNSAFCMSQTHEIGAFIGGSNFIGDVGATNYISPNQLAFGAIYKWNRSPRHSFRFSIIYTDLKGDDSKSDDPRRKQRDYNFTNNLLELSAGLEFTFFDFNLHEQRKASTPYLYTGITYSNYDNYYFDFSGNRISENTSNSTFGIPMVVGFKTTFTQSLILAMEIGARYTFTDEIDGNTPKLSTNQQYRFGNINNNDWYVFSGITLTYTFGRKPCYCNF